MFDQEEATIAAPADLFDGYSAYDADPNAAVVTPPATEPVTPEPAPAAEDPTTVSPDTTVAPDAAAADTATPATDGDNPWGAIEEGLEKPAAADAASQTVTLLQEVASKFSIEEVPTSIEELTVKLNERFEQELTNRLASLAQPEVLAFERMQKLEDFELVSEYKRWANAKRKDSDILEESDAAIKASVMLMEEDETLAPEAARIRTWIDGRKAAMVAAKAKEIDDQKAAELATQQKTREQIRSMHEGVRQAAAKAKDAMDVPLPPAVANMLVNDIMNGTYWQNLNYGPTPEIRNMADGPEKAEKLYAWHVANAARMNEKTSAAYIAQERRRLMMAGETTLVKEIERQQTTVGSGTMDATGNMVVDSSNFIPSF